MVMNKPLTPARSNEGNPRDLNLMRFIFFLYKLRLFSVGTERDAMRYLYLRRFNT